MLIFGCDLQARHQHIAMVDTATGELIERGWSMPTVKHECFMKASTKVYQACRLGASVGIEATVQA